MIDPAYVAAFLFIVCPLIIVFVGAPWCIVKTARDNRKRIEILRSLYK